MVTEVTGSILLNARRDVHFAGVAAWGRHLADFTGGLR
jgi:hypothetical protein